MECPIEQAPGTPLALDGLAEGHVTTGELALHIDALVARVREALTRPLTPEEESAVAELVESLRELLGDDVEL
jgi:hypothetical protein